MTRTRTPKPTLSKYREYTLADVGTLADKAWKYYAQATREQAERYQTILHVIAALQAGIVTSMLLKRSW